MPRRSPRLAIEGRVRSEAEYLEWAARISADAEDIRESVTEERWKAHVRDKYRWSYDPEKADVQMSALYKKGIMRQWEDLPAAGIIPATRYTQRGYYFQYRDVETGRFVSFQTVAERVGLMY